MLGGELLAAPCVRTADTSRAHMYLRRCARQGLGSTTARIRPAASWRTAAPGHTELSFLSRAWQSQRCQAHPQQPGPQAAAAEGGRQAGSPGTALPGTPEKHRPGGYSVGCDSQQQPPKGLGQVGT